METENYGYAIEEEFIPVRLPAEEFKKHAQKIALCTPGDVFSIVPLDGCRIPFVVTSKDPEGIYAYGLIYDTATGSCSLYQMCLDCLWPEIVDELEQWGSYIPESRLCN